MLSCGCLLSSKATLAVHIAEGLSNARCSSHVTLPRHERHVLQIAVFLNQHRILLLTGYLPEFTVHGNPLEKTRRFPLHQPSMLVYLSQSHPLIQNSLLTRLGDVAIPMVLVSHPALWLDSGCACTMAYDGMHLVIHASAGRPNPM